MGLKKQRPPRRALETPYPWSNLTHVSHASKAFSDYLSPIPHLAPALTLSHENKSPSSLFFVQTSPQPWAYGAQLRCCSFPHQIGSPCKGRDGWRKGLRFHLCPGPHTEAWLTGDRGAPTAASLRSNSAANLDSSEARRSSDRQPVLGVLAPRLPRWLS